MKQPVVLKVFRHNKLESVKQFTDKQIVIGREGEVQLALNDPSVSALHAMIEERENGYYISDLGSNSGTLRGGEKILEEKLSSGDELTIGEYHIQFFVGIPKAAAPPVPGPIPHPPADLVRDDTVPPITKVAPRPPPAAKTPPPAQRPTPKVVADEPAPAQQSHAAVFLTPTKQSKKTFAPKAPYKDARDIVKPGKGTVVEVLVLWKERVLSTHHFQDKKEVYIGGGEDADVMVPILAANSKYQLLKIEGSITVCLTPQMTGELIRDNETISLSELSRQNKLRATGSGAELELRQGEMVRIHLHHDLISLMVRYKAETPKPVVAPLLDLTNSEVTGVILAGVIAAIFALYMSLYAPANLNDDEARQEEPIRKAVVTFNPPHEVEKPPEEPKVEKKVVEVKDKQSVKSADKISEMKPVKAKKAAEQSVAKDGNPGKAGDVKPTPNPIKKKKLTSARPGGEIKTGAKQGANMKSDKPDPTKTGLLGTFGKGMQKDLDKAYSGSGELVGMADNATGAAGGNENRDGDNIGTKLKDTGAGGKGTNTIGIAGVGTKGRGTGGTGYGTGGLGSKGSTRIDVGGQDADFTPSIDKEAIRRVILAHKQEIRFCYDQELQKHPELSGKLVIGWNIDEKGHVLKAGVASNALGNSTVANCIVNKLRTWEFPPAPPDVEAHVSYPFVFASQ